jgi:hypothetical protein
MIGGRRWQLWDLGEHEKDNFKNKYDLSSCNTLKKSTVMIILGFILSGFSMN